ncbi:hypothetical protein NE865_10954 [Phthorimaea operculella]|nr:hypothetical protein NE865_10954 [Phthorimaea operculella]
MRTWNYVTNKLQTLRKPRKLSMRQYRIAIGALVAIFSFITLLLYYYWRISSETQIHKTYRGSLEPTYNIIGGSNNNRNLPPPKSASFEEIGRPFRHMRLDLLYKDGNKDDTSLEEERYRHVMFIDTPGCKIPIAIIPYTDKRKRSRSCGKRAVFLKKIGDEEVQAVIKEKTVKTYLRKSAVFECCYRFIIASKRAESRKIKYSACKKFQDGAVIPLETDFVNIKCFEQRKNTSHEVYDDVFAFTKKINVSSKPSTHCKRKYNVLMLGMDSMSLSRFSQVMERSVTFLHENYYLGYRGYHKIGDNTLPNLMAALTGQNISTIKEKCAGNMDKYVEDREASKSILLVESYITNMSKTVKPKHCWGCLPLRLRSVLRIHFYYDAAKVNLYHVVALSMTPGNVSYEAVVLRRGKEAELLGSISVISPYRGLGRCTVNLKDRVFCVCQKIENCY